MNDNNINDLKAYFTDLAEVGNGDTGWYEGYITALRNNLILSDDDADTMLDWVIENKSVL